MQSACDEASLFYVVPKIPSKNKPQLLLELGVAMSNTTQPSPNKNIKSVNSLNTQSFTSRLTLFFQSHFVNEYY